MDLPYSHSEEGAMKTTHQVCFENAQSMADVATNSIDLMVTSPPYPMIEMWDEQFYAADPKIETALKKRQPDLAFERMHRQLDAVWDQIWRVLKPGGLACINIGDATRTVGGVFCLYANHARVIAKMKELGFGQLPTILWQKPTNSPTKFMGSGMLPPGAYVTLEHEYILIFRKKSKREFKSAAQKVNRQQSAYFWEERNQWFSDIWKGLIGTPQDQSGDLRKRSAAYPIELPYRLILMFSVQQDVVLDPFLGTGSTMLAAMALGRSSIGFEVDSRFQPVILNAVGQVPQLSKDILRHRIDQHQDFAQKRTAAKSDMRYINRHHGFAVMSRQEQNMRLMAATSVRFLSDNRFETSYDDHAIEFGKVERNLPQRSTWSAQRKKGRQLELF